MRALAVGIACTALAVGAACGASSSSAAAQSAPPGAAPSSPDPGGTTTTAQPGPPSPQAPPSAPTPGPSPGPGPAPSPGPAPAPAPAPDAFAGVERIDPDPECDALVPANVPEPMALQADDGSFHACADGITEGTGHVALPQNGPATVDYQVVSPAGVAGRQMAVVGAMIPLPDGWQSTRPTGGGFAVQTYLADGTPSAATEPDQTGLAVWSWVLTDDPAGGSLLTWSSTDANQVCRGLAQRFGADGTGRTAAIVACSVPAAGVSTSGPTLVIEAGGPAGEDAVLRWLDPDGNPLLAASADGPLSVAFPNGGSQDVRPLLDGSLVARSGGAWTRRYPPLAAQGEPAPAWLAARAGQTFRFTRGNRGYAFFPPPGVASPDCTQQVELVAPDGRRCARVTFRRDGSGCTTGFIDQGWDGSVVQQTAQEACSWRVWPRFFAAP